MSKRLALLNLIQRFMYTNPRPRTIHVSRADELDLEADLLAEGFSLGGRLASAGVRASLPTFYGLEIRWGAAFTRVS